jgi:hypothetical protein
MREHFLKIIKNYISAYDQQFSGHELANLIRHEIPMTIYNNIRLKDGFICTGSPGQSTWAGCPWIAIFNSNITTSAQEGYYPVYIFRHDMSGFYLTLNQGVTNTKDSLITNKKVLLKETANYFRKEILEIPKNFKELEIDLRPNKLRSHLLSDKYEAGNIIAKFYDSSNLPSDEILIEDLNEILKIYNNLAENNVQRTIEDEKEVDKILASKLPEVEKKRLINARLGQGDFRKDVIAKEMKCRLTGVKNIDFLIASHIKPWCKSNRFEKLDGYNGLLLSPHVDRLFDRGWITFSNEGKVLIAKAAEEIIKTWNISVDNVGNFRPQQYEYLKYHRNNIFKDKI